MSHTLSGTMIRAALALTRRRNAHYPLSQGTLPGRINQTKPVSGNAFDVNAVL